MSKDNRKNEMGPLYRSSRCNRHGGKSWKKNLKDQTERIQAIEEENKKKKKDKASDSI